MEGEKHEKIKNFSRQVKKKKEAKMKRIGTIVIILFLMAGLCGCEGSCTPPGSTPPLQYDLNISSTTGGSVDTPGEGTFSYDAGTVVNLVAVEDDCYEFVNWSGNTVANPNSATTTITMDGDKSITANFELLSYDLIIDSTDGGEVTIPGEETFAYDCGTVVNLVATPDAYYGFVEWTGDVDSIADIYDDSTTITVNGDYSITAKFCLFGGGKGTAESPYQIEDWYHLDNVRNYLNCHFLLMNSLNSGSIGYIELASTVANEGKGWQPIGTIVEGAKFSGSFNGQGYNICDLAISRLNESDVGLFGVISETGFVENVNVVGNVTGQDNVGALAGKNEGAIKNSSSTGSVTGDDYIGGLVGKNEGSTNSSYSSSGVIGNMRIGGLVGQNSNTVNDSYSTGSVTGDDYVGGLIGKNEGAVNNSYSTGSVTGDDYIGGLVGKNEGTVSNSFWDTQTSGQAASDGGTGKTTAEMMNIDTFTNAGWNITVVNLGEKNPDYVWNIVGDATHPFLSWQD